MQRYNKCFESTLKVWFFFSCFYVCGFSDFEMLLMNCNTKSTRICVTWENWSFEGCLFLVLGGGRRGRQRREKERKDNDALKVLIETWGEHCATTMNHDVIMSWTWDVCFLLLSFSPTNVFFFNYSFSLVCKLISFNFYI